MHQQPRAKCQRQQAVCVLTLKKTVDPRRFEHPLRHLGIGRLEKLADSHKLIRIYDRFCHQLSFCSCPESKFAPHDVSSDRALSDSERATRAEGGVEGEVEESAVSTVAPDILTVTGAAEETPHFAFAFLCVAFCVLCVRFCLCPFS